MAPGTTVEQVLRLAGELSPLDKLRVIERLAPELEAALIANTLPTNPADLDEQYQRGYERSPEDTTELKALLPHLPVPAERWE